MYKELRFYENCNKGIFNTDNPFGFPVIRPYHVDTYDLTPFNYMRSIKHKESKGLHFFIDDYQFQRVWNSPDLYLDSLRSFKYVCMPDFSLYTDFPKAIQIYNCYRNFWLAAYWQYHNINVLPTALWGDPDTFDWCFSGLPQNTDIIVNPIGTQDNFKSKELFKAGFMEMCNRIHPSKVIVYGLLPKNVPKSNLEIIEIETITDKLHSFRGK